MFGLERRLQALERKMREIRGDRGATEPAAWTPAWTNLTVVGSPTYTGTYVRVGQLVFCRALITAGGAITTASTAASTYINNVPVTPASSNVVYVSNEAVANYGVGYVFASLTRAYTPTWTATNANITIAFWFLA